MFLAATLDGAILSLRRLISKHDNHPPPTADMFLHLFSQTLLGQSVDEIDTLDEVVSDLTLKVKTADPVQTVTYPPTQY